MTKSIEIRGKPKSGKTWKDVRPQKSSMRNVLRKRVSFEERKAQKEKVAEIKELEQSLKDAAREKKIRQASLIAERKRKAMEKDIASGTIVKKASALKKMSKKAYQQLQWASKTSNKL
ncbi:MAG: hypothetical protein PW999_21355 [Paraburkholderia tropica]|nr:hypothetical protein [Paraburkholderia tropica]